MGRFEINMIWRNIIGRFGVGLMLMSVIFIGSCTQITTASQREKFEQCRKIAIEFYDNPENQKYIKKVTLMDKKTIEDLKKMSLEEIVTKYDIPSSEIDRYISLICACKEIKEAYEKLENKLEISDELMELNKMFKKDSTFKISVTFDFGKIQPLKFKGSGYINLKNDTTYIDENGDSVRVKVKIAKYE